MKKLLIATAVAATMATGAHAATYEVTSNITAVGLYLGELDLMTAEAPGFQTIQFGGFAYDTDDNGTIDSSALTLTGQQGFTVNALQIKLTYNLSSGGYAAGSGVTFTGGDILIETYSDTSGWLPYGTIDAATTNLPFLANQPGHWVDQYPNQTTAGLLLAPGLNTLPGLWDQVAESSSFNNGVAALTLLGQSSGMFLQGTVTLEPIPIPGAAWLFGSAVLGLAGASRKRKTA
jgi:hypothetical protein